MDGIIALLDSTEEREQLARWALAALAVAGFVWLAVRAIKHEKNRLRERGEVVPPWGRLIGRCEFRPGGSFITTEWTPIFPLFPMRSFRIQALEEGIFWRSCPRKFLVLEHLPVCWPQVRRIYAFRLGWLCLVYAGWCAVGSLPKDWLSSQVEGVATVYLFLVFLPVLLRGMVWQHATHRARLLLQQPTHRQPGQFKFACPHCGQRVSATTDQSATEASCPACNEMFVVP